MLGTGHSLEKIIDGAVQLKQVRKEELQFGDLVLITTRNSDYSVCVLEDENYIVSGGWFAGKDSRLQRFPSLGVPGGAVSSRSIHLLPADCAWNSATV